MTGVALVGVAALVFNEGVPIGDRLDAAIEKYLACLDSESTERQSCVEQLFADVQDSINASQITPEQQTGMNEALNDLEECLQQSSSVQQDFLCLRTLYGTIVDTLKLPLRPLDKSVKRVYATNKAIATNCYHQATTTLRQCLESIKTIQDPTQRETARQSCLKEYRTLLQSCLCLSYPAHPACK
jgi:hypothetical protein